MLPVQIFEMRKHLLTLFLGQPKQNTKAMLKTYELLIFGDIT
jgi:hypothetical protein